MTNTNDTATELRTIADTIETNGGWHIAAVKVRAAAEEIERLQADLDLLMRAGCIVRENAFDGRRFVEVTHSSAEPVAGALSEQRIGAGIPPDGAPSMPFAQQMQPDTRPLTHQEIFSAVHHHAAEIVRLTAAVPVERLAGCRNWKPKHGVGPYCGNCGFHENEHADLHR